MYFLDFKSIFPDFHSIFYFEYFSEFCQNNKEAGTEFLGSHFFRLCCEQGGDKTVEEVIFGFFSGMVA